MITDSIITKNMLYVYCNILITVDANVHTGSIVVTLFVTLLVFTFLGWLGYAYFNPNTSSGRFLIKVCLYFN